MNKLWQLKCSFLLVATLLAGCATIIDTHYVYKAADETEFRKALIKLGYCVLRSGDTIFKVKGGTKLVLEVAEPPIVELTIDHKKKVDAEFSSYTAQVVVADQIHDSTIRVFGYDSQYYQQMRIRIPDSASQSGFRLILPSLMVNGIEHTVPAFDFKTVRGKRKTDENRLCWYWF
jgi:hypothetical protein